MTTIRQFRFQLLFGAVVVCTYWLVSWLLISESSPLFQRFNREGTEDRWVWVYLIPMIITNAIIPERWGIARVIGFWIFTSCFWFAVGFVAGLVLRDPYRSWRWRPTSRPHRKESYDPEPSC
jgi:hypothetical protein